MYNPLLFNFITFVCMFPYMGLEGEEGRAILEKDKQI